MIRRTGILLGINLSLALASPALAQQATGIIRGVSYDSDFDAPLAGVAVTIAETGAKVRANDQGIYTFPAVPPGRYTLIFTKDGYLRQVRSGIVVTASQLTDVDVELAGDFEDMDEFVVQEILPGGTDAGLLELRLESPSLLDSIGSEIMNRAGASDAASALSLVSGASVQDGKYAVVRGLPDRYVSSQVNGVRLPSADEEKRAVELDQFPSAVIESVQVSKTFTPDQQGDASGGAVNVVLKGIPDETSIQFKIQYNANSQVVGAGSRFLTSPGGGVNYWGQEGANQQAQPDGTSWTSPTGTSFTDAPINYKWSLSGGGKWELNDGVTVGGFASFFYENDASYSDNGIDDSWVLQQGSSTPVPEQFQRNSADDFNTQLFDVTQSNQEVNWGGLGTWGIETEQHRVTGTYLYTNSTDDTTTVATDTRGHEYYFPGYRPNDPDYPEGSPFGPPNPGNGPPVPPNIYGRDSAPYNQLTTLDWVQRTTSTLILNGRHELNLFNDSDSLAFLDAPELDWSWSTSSAKLNEPNKTQFGAIWMGPTFQPGLPIFGIPDTWGPSTWQALPPSDNINLGWAQHIFEEINESSNQYAINLKLPFALGDSREGYFKVGVFGDSVNRTYNQDTYSNSNDPNFTYSAGVDPYSGFEPPVPLGQPFGADFSTQPWSAVFPSEDHPMVRSTYDVDYTGQQNISAYYLMLDMPLSDTFTVVGGARNESFAISTTVDPGPDAVWYPPNNPGGTGVALNPGDADADYSQDLWLPSISAMWDATEEVTIRAAFANTTAYPVFREITPVLQQEFLGGPIFIGNPDLTASQVTNYDLRADYRPFEGGLFSVSWFYKDIQDPIEYVQELTAYFSYVTPRNYPSGTMNGIEVDARQDLGVLMESLTGLSVMANWTLISSNVILPESEQDALAAIGFPQSSRPMVNAPEYLLNLGATWDAEEIKTDFGLFYTLTGDTLVAGAGQADEYYVPEIYSLPVGQLNFTVQHELARGFKCFFAAKNLLNPEIQTAYKSKYIDGGQILNTSYTEGIDFSAGISLQIDF